MLYISRALQQCKIVNCENCEIGEYGVLCAKVGRMNMH